MVWLALSLVVGAVATGVALQLWKGLPREPPAWYAPKRLLKLDHALLDQLTLVQYLPLALPLRAFRRSRETQLGLLFGEHGLHLDAFSRRTGGAPLIVFAFGGGWGSGSRHLYGLLAKTLVERGCAVVVPDYRLPPLGRVEEMLGDLRDAWRWARAHASELGADVGRIHLVGHSAGAHLWALMLVRARLEGDRELLDGVASFTGLSGIYDIAAHHRHEHGRGVEAVSAMHWVMGDSAESFARASPVTLLSGIATAGRVPKIALVHGTEDVTVPVSSSEQFHTILEDVGWPSTFVRLGGAGHLDPVVDLMREGPSTETLLSLLAPIWE